MKRIFFCLIILLAFFRTTHSYASEVRHADEFGNFQEKSPPPHDKLQKSAIDHFYIDLLELAEDDTNDPEDEDCSFDSRDRENLYLISFDSYNSSLKRIHFNRHSFCQGLPFFILRRTLRI